MNSLKFVILFFFATVCFQNTYGQGYDPEWAKRYGDQGSEYINKIVCDSSGNTFAICLFNSASITVGTLTFNNSGGTDFLIIKSNAAGDVLWAKRFGGSGEDVATSIALISNGDCIITGASNSPTFLVGTFGYANQGGHDMFIIRLNSGGGIVYSEYIGFSGDEIPYSVTVNEDAFFYAITGKFNGSEIWFGPHGTNNNASGADIFVVKYDFGGGAVWAKFSTSTNDNLGSGIGSDQNGNIYIAGPYLSNSLSFGSLSVSNSSSFYRIFIAKFDVNGNPVWLKEAGGSDYCDVFDFKTDKYGNCYFAGVYGANPCSFTNITLTNSGETDAYLAKYNTNGSPIWVKKIGSNLTEAAWGVSLDSDNNVFVAGYYNSPQLTIGNTTFNNSNGQFDYFIAKYSTTGLSMWTRYENSQYDLGVYAMCAYKNQNIYIAGDFSGSALFGTQSINSSGGFDAFTTKFTLDFSGTNQSEDNNTVKIYPNPSNGTFTIENLNQNIIKYSINDVTGKCIYEQSLSNTNEQPLNISLSLTRGLYFVTFLSDSEHQNGTNSFTKKLLID